jgi:para-nitrobenzyl esterase
MAVVETRSGKLEGIERDGVLQFRGIPFAAPPVGELRWRAPRPPAPWTGVRAAHEFGPIAPQVPSPTTLLPRGELPEASEDCLNLNVFTPGTDGPARPVLVWIHGGAFTGGSGRNPWYNGTSFARGGAVVVTINYRLGALGFLHLGADAPGSGNCGLLDQVLALEWVRDNIAAFGGDPANVTVFGESAGGMSVGCLLGMPAARGLFRQAIPQSGAASTVLEADRAAEVTERLIARVGGRDGLAAASVDELLAAQVDVQTEMLRTSDGLSFRPVVDGVVLPEPPLQAVAAGSAASVRILAGTTRDESTLFLAAVPGFREVDEETVVRRLDRVLPGRARALYDGYAASLGSEPAPADVWVAIETDRRFRIPAIHLIEAQAPHSDDRWMYLFTWESPALDGMLRACHALELPFVWNTLGTPGSEGFTGSGPAAEALAGEMHGAWLEFAGSGDPGWPRYDIARRATRVFGPNGVVVEDPMAETRQLWDD